MEPIKLADRGCLAALAAQLGHQAPFTSEELASIESLTVTHARDLDALAACTGLRHLRVIASEVESFLFCEALTELAHLEVHCSLVQSLSGLAFCPKLERVDLLFTSVTEGRPLFGTAAWCRGTLVGNPWSQLSWETLSEVADWSAMLIQFSPMQEWQRTCELWSRVGVCSGVLEDLELLVRPGLPTLTSNTYDALHLGPAVRRALRAPGLTLEALFRDHQGSVEAPELSPVAQLYELGRGDDVLRWIAESGLPTDDQAALATLVKRFPEIVFYRTGAQARAALVQEAELPPWYLAQLGAINGWMPLDRRPPVRFAAFERPDSPRASSVAARTYHLGLREHGDDETGQALRAAGFVACALSIEDPECMLAFRNDGDPTIFEYHHGDVSDAVSEGRGVSTSIYPAFRSYASMLGSIVSLHPPDRDPVSAQ
jgi:hypothetical protein